MLKLCYCTISGRLKCFNFDNIIKSIKQHREAFMKKNKRKVIYTQIIGIVSTSDKIEGFSLPETNSEIEANGTQVPVFQNICSKKNFLM